jgi:hypothetical protein
MAMTMPESLESEGICRVCALRGNCEIADSSEMPLMSCEHFEPDPVQVREMVSLALVQKENKTPSSVSSRHMGLCKNCEHRDECILPGNEGGVWYCEEYE